MKNSNPNIVEADKDLRTEWNEYLPEMIEAIREGYMDDILGQLVFEAETRRTLVQRFGYYMVATKKPLRRKKKS